jgi:hypothetical protein
MCSNITEWPLEEKDKGILVNCCSWMAEDKNLHSSVAVMSHQHPIFVFFLVKSSAKVKQIDPIKEY